jgi:hypothetical protein
MAPAQGGGVRHAGPDEAGQAPSGRDSPAIDTGSQHKRHKPNPQRQQVGISRMAVRKSAELQRLY